MTVRRTTFQLRQGVAALWVSRNTILSSGEPGVETDTRRWKVGDGTTPWNALPYMQGSSGSAGGGNSFIHFQSTPAAQWTIQHDTGAYREPVVLLASDPTHPVLTDVEFVTADLILLIFPEPVSGVAYL